MATLEAMAIAGIRSYDPQILQKIVFETPITLIHGKNGSGKTTIIECLKYITTGTFPPGTDRGKLFLMDPKISKKSETVGDVRLRFRTAKGRQIIAKKKCTTSCTAKGLSFKSTEQSLRTKDQNGEQIQINHRCADIDKQMPQLLGMTKPILQNIVFCHQDQSLWPFADNSTLKNIFDELFDTRRFSKAMESMKEGIKELDKEKNYIRGEIGHLSQRYKKSQEMRTNSLFQLLQVVRLSELTYSLQMKLQPINQKLSEYTEDMQKVNEMNRSKGSYEAKVMLYQEEVISLEKKLLRYQDKIDDYGEEQIFGRRNEAQKQKLRLQKELINLQGSFSEVRYRQDAQKSKKQIYLQIKRAEEEVKGLETCTTAEQYNLRLKQIVKQLEGKQFQLRKLQNEYNRKEVPLIPKTTITEQDKQSKMQALKKGESNLERIENKIWVAYKCLYSNQCKEGNYEGSDIRRNQLESRLSRLKAQIQMKKNEQNKYRQMNEKKSKKDPYRELIEINYAGITFQEQILQYMERKRKCAACNQTLNDEQIEDLKKRVFDTKEKTKRKIQEIKKQNPQMGLNLQSLLHQINEYLQRTSEEIEKLQKQLEKEEEHARIRNKLRINKAIDSTLLALGITYRKSILNKVDENFTLENMRELANQFRMQLHENKNLERQLSEMSKRNQQINELTIKHREIVEEKKEILRKIELLEKETKKLGIIRNISQKIGCLLEKALVKRQSESGNSCDSSSEQLQNLIISVQVQIEQNRKYFEYLLYLQQYQRSKFKLSAAMKELQDISEKIDKSKKAHIENDDLLREKKELQIQIQKSKVRITEMTKQSIFEVPDEKEYLKKIIRLNAINGLVADIQNSIKAMDRAISRLHNQKMDEVNRILFDVWQDVYHGGDIEFIRINSVNEKKNKAGYSYSIIMKKNGELLQMKGRCSMGQKVLASLIIRMALAEAFSANTHILALDEPTTNLDRAHIDKLAESIGSLLDMENSRLQLIIISHDIQFIRLLSKYTNSYIEVIRDSKNNSILNKRDIVELELKITGQTRALG